MTKMSDTNSATEAATNGKATPQTTNTSGKRAAPTPPSSVKKRPYRRTKRPKNYNDKSTVTTTTPTLANRPVNVYDAVLGECEDLLLASLEAQRLGRLKMASAYQLLLHTRLVGLGKRFDRASIVTPTRRRRRGDDDDDEEEDYDESEEESQAASREPGIIEQNPPPSAQGAATATAAAAAPAVAPGEMEEPPKNLPPALQQLTSILPSNLEMDTTMMEHLARAAVELHHQRTGRKKSADGLLASPMTGIIGSPPEKEEKDNAKIAWSAEEQKVVEKALEEKKATYAIAKMLKNKTEAQVKAFIKNQEKSSKQNNALADDLGSPGKKRGGRGRKPPTTAMNTVPNANLDARSLLKGVLKRAS